MKKIRTLVIISSLVLFLIMALSAISLAVFVPGDSWGKKLIAGILMIFSLLPVIIGVIMLKSVNAFTKHTEKFATRDPLTKLYNRRTFWDYLGYEIERARRQDYRFSIMLIDLDNFKAINDLYGHEVGDAYLLEFSALFKLAVRKGDIVARYGGDDFAAVLPICDEGQSYSAAKRLLDSLHDHSFLLPNGATAQITASIGMAVYPDHAKDAESLFMVADTMLHQAKLSGKDRMHLPSDEVNLEILKTAGGKSFFIMDSIKKDRIVPYFQPIVSVGENKVLAYEMLTRIITPERVVPAIEFIEAAEGMGAISKIDYILIEKAFDLMKRNGYKGLLFLNLSPKVLVLNKFMPGVRRLMTDYGVEPSQLVFEITERDTVKNLTLIEKAVLDLKGQGFQLAIDDFGAGYSSFQYLRMFKVDFLKIDGEFIRHMDGNGGMEQAIVSNIAKLAGELGIKTIAEYVETEAILDYVRAASINYAQGYYIQDPQPAMTY